MRRCLAASSAVVLLASLVAGCGGSKGKVGSREATGLPGGAGSPSTVSSSTTRAGEPAASAAPTRRLAPSDPGVQTGLQLLRGEITAAQAAAAWRTDGLTPAQAKDVVARLPLTTPAPGPGTHTAVARIADAFGRTTDISLSVPASAPARGHPVVVFLHGINGDSGDLSGVAAALPGWLVVAPSAQAPPSTVVYEDNAPGNVLGALPHWWVYRDGAFATKALDWVRERYEVDEDRIVLMGLSMGGFGAWNVGLRLHDRFAGLIAGAGGMSRLEFALPPDQRTRALLDNAAMLPTYNAHGDQDPIIPVRFSRQTDQDLTARGIAHTYRELAGAGHDKAAFLGNPTLLRELSAWLAARTRDAHPAAVGHRAINADHLGAFWVELKGTSGSVLARATAATNTLAVTTAAPATGAVVFIDPKLVDVAAPVTVTVNGATLLQGVPTPSLEAVARSFARTRDPELTYTHMVQTQ